MLMKFAYDPNVLSTISSEICSVYTAKQEQKDIQQVNDNEQIQNEIYNNYQI